MNRTTCASWAAKKDENPVTRRHIKLHGPTYKMYDTYCNISSEKCKEFRNTPTVNPVTKKRINPTAKRGLFQILDGVCELPSSLPTEEKRRRLIAALQKNIKPFMHKMDQQQYRIKIYHIIEKYVADMEPCIQINAKKNMTLNDVNGDPIIHFAKRIGSNSQYGMAYANVGKGFGRLLNFSTKLMPYNAENKKEIQILTMLRDNVIHNDFPHFPIMYHAVKCTNACVKPGCPPVTKNGPYYVVLSELANMDLQQWLKEAHKQADYESVIMQYILALRYFHSAGFYHGDTHLGNALIHKVTPGGYWVYKFGNHTLYVPNTGYFLVLWDFGMSKLLMHQTTEKNAIHDIWRPLYLISHMDEYREYKGMVRPPAYLVRDVLLPACEYLGERLATKYSDKSVLGYVFDLPWKFIYKSAPSHSHLINKTPYMMG